MSRNTLLPTIVLTLSACGLLTAGHAHADDFAPPEWRGDPLSFKFVYEFNNVDLSQPEATIFPDEVSSVGGSGGEYPYTGDGMVNVPVDNQGRFYDQEQWDVSSRTYQGTTYLGIEPDGTIDPHNEQWVLFMLQNWVDTESLKHVRLQFTFLDYYYHSGLHGITEPRSPWLAVAYGGETPDASQVVYGLGIDPVFVDDNHAYLDFTFSERNPHWDAIEIGSKHGVILDELVIDTISVPEPATLGLLALGGLALIRRRRAA